MPADFNIDKEMTCLYRNLQFLLPDVPKRVLQFVGSWEGEGASTICQEFAKVSARTFGNSVLLLDADQHPPNPASHFEADPSLSEIRSDELSSSQAFWHVKGMSLCVGSLPRWLPSPLPLADAQGPGAFWKKLKEGFDLVLIDSPPAITSPECLSLCRWTDGVILIVEAERISQPVVEHVRESIVRNGGRILGMVLNKRRYPIPGFLYKRL
jgi:protein-tyrosine kinase